VNVPLRVRHSIAGEAISWWVFDPSSFLSEYPSLRWLTYPSHPSVVILVTL
jgi:hypothetical protein